MNNIHKYKIKLIYPDWKNQKLFGVVNCNGVTRPIIKYITRGKYFSEECLIWYLWDGYWTALEQQLMYGWKDIRCPTCNEILFSLAQLEILYSFYCIAGVQGFEMYLHQLLELNE